MTAEILALSALTNVVVFFGLWLLSLRLKDASIIDSYWAVGFTVIAWAALLWSGVRDWPAWVLVGVLTAWGLRHGSYMVRRWLREGKEDPRYRKMRENRGAAFPLFSLIVVYGLQAFLMWFISLPVQIGIIEAADRPLMLWDLVGIALFFIGFSLEAVADFQLAAFKSNPANNRRVLTHGLWRWSRHPNYFGNALMWWGIFFIAAPATNDWWLAMSPALMTYLLLRVSGVTLLEQRLVETKSDYAAYQKRTSAFVPWPPRLWPLREREA